MKNLRLFFLFDETFNGDMKSLSSIFGEYFSPGEGFQKHIRYILQQYNGTYVVLYNVTLSFIFSFINYLSIHILSIYLIEYHRLSLLQHIQRLEKVPLVLFLNRTVCSQFKSRIMHHRVWIQVLFVACTITRGRSTRSTLAVTI